MSNSHDTNEIDTNLQKSILEAYQHDLRLNILMLLMIYRELSLTQISNLLGKSKSTISRHTRKLIELRLIKSHTKEDEIQAGNIKRKYYAITKDFLQDEDEGIVPDLLKSITEPNDLLNAILGICNAQKALFLLVQRITEISRAPFENLSERMLGYSSDLETLGGVLQKLFNSSKDLPDVSVAFLNEKQFTKYLGLKLELERGLTEIMKEDNGSERPYLVIGLSTPIKNLLESKGRIL
ncbi:MAG: ArsR/SmtB family transcription factor [Candidatus Hodarchaeota archaeon]